MSRSIHKTVKGVLGGKPESEINEMIQDEDDEVWELAKKWEYKRYERDKRDEQKPRIS